MTDGEYPTLTVGTVAEVARTHVLLDLDGTLSASAPGITRSLHAAMVSEGFDAPDVDEMEAFVGPPLEVMLPQFGVPIDRVWDVIERYRVRYDDVGLYETSAYDGVADMVHTLHDAGLTLAIATSKPEVTARRIIEHFGWSDRFAVVAGATFDATRRTKAQVITHALAQLEIEAGPHVVMVGDREHDVHGAQAHDLDCIGVTWGYAPDGELYAAGATWVATTPAEVVALVLGHTAVAVGQ